MPKRKQENNVKEVGENLPELNEPPSAYADSLPQMDVLKIVPSPFEPQTRRRAHFKQNELEELATSIFQNGLIQPVILRPAKNEGMFELIAGERRWLGAKIAGLKVIPYLLRDISDETALEIQMKENLNRLEPDPLDEAYSFKYLMEHYNLSPADIAGKFGRTESLVLRRLKLNGLIKEVIADMEIGKLPLGHAEEIALFPTETQKEILKTCIYKWNDKNYGAEPLDKCKKRIVDNIVLNLSKAVFDKTATNLHPDELACINCEKRTGFTPTLFDAEITKNDHCLDKSCFQQKVSAHNTFLKISLMDKIRAELPEFKDLSNTELESKIPLVSEDYIYSGEKSKFGAGNYLNNQTFLESAECEASSPALVVNGKREGSTVYVCTSEECEIHVAEETDSEPDAWDLKKAERDFGQQVQQTVRVKVLQTAGDFFQTEMFWETQFLWREFIYHRLKSYLYRINNYEEIKPIFRHLVDSDDWGNEKTVKKLVDGLTDAELSYLLFQLHFIDEGYSSYEPTNQDRIKQIAGEYTELNYDLLDAEIRLELAPEEFKPLAESYLEKIKAGESAEIPAFWWTDEAKAKFEAEDSKDDEDEDDENYEYDDDDDALDSDEETEEDDE